MGDGDVRKFKVALKVRSSLSGLTFFYSHTLNAICMPHKNVTALYLQPSQLRYNGYSKNKMFIPTKVWMCLLSLFKKPQPLKVWLYTDLRKGWVGGKVVASYGKKNESGTSDRVWYLISLFEPIPPAPSRPFSVRELRFLPLLQVQQAICSLRQATSTVFNSSSVILAHIEEPLNTFSDNY